MLCASRCTTRAQLFYRTCTQHNAALACIVRTRLVAPQQRLAPLAYLRHASTSSSAASAAAFSDAESSLSANAMPLQTFYTLCDTALDGIQNRLEMPDLEPVLESELTTGAMSIKVDGVGAWVLNRQTPNRQIWFASTLTGPKRYDYDVASKQWTYARDRSKLKDILERELSAATKIEIRFDEHF